MSGEFLPNTCEENRPNYDGVYTSDSAVDGEASAESTDPNAVDASATDAPVAMNSEWW